MGTSDTQRECQVGRQASPAVVSLASYRLARRAADVLTGLMHGASFVHGVVVEVPPDGKPMVVATVTRRTRAVLMAFPRSVDGIPVEVRAGRSGRTRGA